MHEDGGCTDAHHGGGDLLGYDTRLPDPCEHYLALEVSDDLHRQCKSLSYLRSKLLETFDLNTHGFFSKLYDSGCIHTILPIRSYSQEPVISTSTMVPASAPPSLMITMPSTSGAWNGALPLRRSLVSGWYPSMS